MKWLILVNIIIDYYMIAIKSQVIRRWSPEDLISKALDNNAQDSYFISDPNHYFESADIASLTKDLKQIYAHFHFTVFVFVFPQMASEYTSLEGDEGINKFTNDTLHCFLQRTDFSEESIILIVYPIENEVIKIIGGGDVLDVYTEDDLFDILKRQLDNFRDEKLTHSFHSIFEEIGHDSPHSFAMKIKYLIWRYQSLSIGFVAGLLFILKISNRKSIQNEAFIVKMQMFVLQLKFQAKWKSHCMICLEKLPSSAKKQRNARDDSLDDDDDEDDQDQKETENNSKKKHKRGESNEDEDEDDEEEKEEVEDEEEEEDKKTEDEIINKKQKNKVKADEENWEEYNCKEEEEDDDNNADNNLNNEDQLKLALTAFSNQKQQQQKDKGTKSNKKQSLPADIPPALSIKIRKSLRQREKKTKKKPKREEEKSKAKSKAKAKVNSKNHSRRNSNSKAQTNHKESSLFVKKSLTKATGKPKQEEQNPVNIFKSKFTIEDQLDTKRQEKITFDCGHSFHRRCFDEWHEIKHTSSCPVCDYHVFSNSNQIGDDSFKKRLVKLQQVFHPELKDIDVNL